MIRRSCLLLLFLLFLSGHSLPAAAKFAPIPEWMRKAKFYQIYPQSFKDTDGDGIGDIRGIISKLDYIKELGCNAIWINPCFESAFKDAGYDVIDYYSVAKRYGTNADLQLLFAEAHKRDMKICLDLVAGHTSDQSEWFIQSTKKRRNKYSDRFIWTTDSTIMPEKHVKGHFERNGTYRKNYFDCQPALNYGFANPDPNNPWEQSPSAAGPTATRKELFKIMQYWMDKGCDGFRVDMAGSLVKNDPDLIETAKLWYEIRTKFQKRYPQGVILAEWGYPLKSHKAGFMMDFAIQFGDSGYGQLFFNEHGTYRRDTCYFDSRGVGSPFYFGNKIETYLNEITEDMYICIPTSNHDFQRPNCGSRNTTEQLKCAMLFFLTMPGVPMIYYGDEIGMRFIEGLPDKEGSLIKKGNRAGSRTPMQWDDNAFHAGFSTNEHCELYLPVDSAKNRPNVKTQLHDANSMYNFTRNLLTLRDHEALGNRGAFKLLNKPGQPYPLVYMRSSATDRYIILINPTDRTTTYADSDLYKNTLTEVLISGVLLSKQELNFKLEPFSYAIYQLSATSQN